MNQSQKLNIESAITQFKLANAWQIQGKFEDAFIRYQETLRLRPDYMPAYQQLGNLMLKQQRMEEALEYYDQALLLDFEATDLTYYYQCFGLPKLTNNQRINSENISFPIDAANAIISGKINLGKQKIFGYHRSGWNFAIQALSPLHNPEGVLFDGCLEHQFLFQHTRIGKRSPRILEKMRVDGVFQRLATSEEKGIIPYEKPWVGLLHNPHAMPIWFSYQTSPQKLFEKEVWQASLPHCIGLFALSEYYAEWLREQTGKPVSVLTHPTEIPDKKFDFDQFLTNSQKKVIQIGWWLRKLHSIYQLPLAQDNPLNYQKVRLGFLFDSGEAALAQLMQKEARIYKIQVDESYLANTTVIQHVPDDEYDDLLSKNIAFLDLYDSSANNAIIECIARGTPLLVNPLPAVKEYLGDDYPMYFNTLKEAADKALDTSLILETHEYLKSCEIRQKLSAEYFLESFCKSQVYQLL